MPIRHRQELILILILGETKDDEMTNGIFKGKHLISYIAVFVFWLFTLYRKLYYPRYMGNTMATTSTSYKEDEITPLRGVN